MRKNAQLSIFPYDFLKIKLLGGHPHARRRPLSDASSLLAVKQCCPQRGPRAKIGSLEIFVGPFKEHIFVIVMVPLINDMQESGWP